MKLTDLEQIHERDFIEVLEFADVFIFDYPTTAFAYAAATNKPIIYFDIGLRNLTTEALKSIKSRCIYIKGKADNPEPMILALSEKINEKCLNNYSIQYSLSEDKGLEKKYWKTL